MSDLTHTAPPVSAGALRARFRREGIDAARLGSDPLAAFRRWQEDWASTAPFDPLLASLATVDAHGRPSVRAMDIAGVDHGFVFMTHGASPKAMDLAERPHAALSVCWPEIGRQIRVQGTVERLDGGQAAEAFQRLPRTIRLVAHATRQSAVLAERSAMEQAFHRVKSSFPDAEPGLPPAWSGHRLVPLRMEFWQQRPDDLQDRIVFFRETAASPWGTQRLSP